MVGKVPFGLRSQIKNIPGLKQLQSGLLKRWMGHESFVATISGGPAKGLVFPVQMPQDKLMWLGTWELDFAKFLQTCIKKGFICYDIGGYKGYYAGIMALSGAKEVHVFEPMSANAESLKKMISLNPNLSIKLHQLAVTNFTGHTDFKVMSDATMGKLISSGFQNDAKNSSLQKVECNSIDQLIHSGLSDPDFIKIDVEGSEIQVIEGAFKLIKRKKPILLVEIHSRNIGQKCFESLKSFYSRIYVFETQNSPGNSESEICHYVCLN